MLLFLLLLLLIYLLYRSDHAHRVTWLERALAHPLARLVIVVLALSYGLCWLR